MGGTGLSSVRLLPPAWEGVPGLGEGDFLLLLLFVAVIFVAMLLLFVVVELLFVGVLLFLLFAEKGERKFMLGIAQCTTNT